MKIEDITKGSFIASTIGILSVIGPGFALIFTLMPDLFINLDWVKLLFLSISLMLPTLVMMFLIFLFRALAKKIIDDSSHEWLVLSLCFNGFYLYEILIVSYFSNISFKYLYCGYIIFLFLVLVFYYFRLFRFKKR